MNKILFTGITGLLGKYFLMQKTKKYGIVGIYNNNKPSYKNTNFKINILDKKKIISVIKSIKPNVVVHAASIGNVDYCESHGREAYEVNVEGTRNVLKACGDVGAKIIFISSNAVYDGEHPPYNEESKLNPLDVYGKTKVRSEEIVSNGKSPYVILRLMTMYGWPPPGARNNPVSWIIEELRQNKKIKIVNDIYNNHLFAGQAADAIWKVIEQNKTKEVYNIAGRDCISRYKLALNVAEIFNFDSSLITPVKSDFFKNIAPRPKNTCFDTTKIKKELGVRPFSMVDGLTEMKNE